MIKSNEYFWNNLYNPINNTLENIEKCVFNNILLINIFFFYEKFQVKFCLYYSINYIEHYNLLWNKFYQFYDLW